MPAENAVPTCANLIRAPYIEGGRLKWEARSAGALLRMFAADGHDIRREHDGQDSHCRIVTSQDGHDVAMVLWCDSIPNYAYAFTIAA